MKKVMYSLLALFLVVGLATGCSCDKKEDKKQKGNSTVLDDNVNVDIKDQKVNELDIIDFVIVYEDGISDISFTIANNTDNTVTYNSFECSMYNKNKELLYSFTGAVGALESLDEKDISYRVNIDLTKVAKVEYVLK